MKRKGCFFSSSSSSSLTSNARKTSLHFAFPSATLACPPSLCTTRKSLARGTRFPATTDSLVSRAAEEEEESAAAAEEAACSAPVDVGAFALTSARNVAYSL